MGICSKSVISGLICCMVLGFSVVSCQVSTPDRRIAANPAVYSALPAKHQELVSKGQICEGMSEDAVFLAWGAPGTPPYEGERNGKRLTRWVYNVSEPVFVDTPPFYGPYYCPYHGHGAWHYHPYTGPDVVYVPRNAASVVFENGKVVSWECRSSR